MKRNVGVITIYPERENTKTRESAMAPYSFNWLSSFPTEIKQSIVVLSNYSESKNTYIDQDLLIDNCWKRGSMNFVIDILKKVREYDLRKVYFQHEFNLFGSISTIPLFILLTALLRASGVEVNVTYHGVISQKIVKGEFNKINQIKLPNIIIRLAFGIIFKAARFFINNIVVHEQVFKEVLVSEYKYDAGKIKVIPHGIKVLDQEDKIEARRYLGLNPKKKVLLYFGFLAGYKGLDFLLDAFRELDQAEYELVIAGGKPKRVEGDKQYNKWYNNLHCKIKKVSNISAVGFVPEEEIVKYFSAADLLVLPYLQMLAGSGPMSLAIGYGLPFIASEVFLPVWGEKFCFNLDVEDFTDMVESELSNLEQLEKSIKVLQKDRAWGNLVERYLRFMDINV